MNAPLSTRFIAGIIIILMLASTGPVDAAELPLDHQRATWHPLHFKPDIDKATDDQCLACHSEILQRRPRARSPAGLEAKDALAWYQVLSTYEGEQETFHRRHLVTPLAARLMKLRCNTCHQGNNPREEAPIPPETPEPGFTLRKMVDPAATCLKCHGKFPAEVMNLPGPWHEVREQMSDNCMLCHVAIRTKRHEVNYLNAAAIEEDGAKNSDVCYGCHGGRAWYRIAYPYPRHAWPGMSGDVPDWAKDRPTESESRFQVAK